MEQRLIDANALKNAHIECPENVSFFGFGEIVERFMQAIDEQQTVDAVPVEWIQGFMNRLRNKGQTVCVAAIQGMLEAYGANGEREPANGYGVMAARMLE